MSTVQRRLRKNLSIHISESRHEPRKYNNNKKIDNNNKIDNNYKNNLNNSFSLSYNSKTSSSEQKYNSKYDDDDESMDVFEDSLLEHSQNFVNDFNQSSSVFINGDLAINSNGIMMRNNPKEFQLAYDELSIGNIIGQGASGVVLEAYHIPTNTPLALKVISLADRGRRDQLIREVCSLYDAQCQSIITFYGAFYREGSISIALEYMDGGSLFNVIDQLGSNNNIGIPENILASMAYQILWGLAYIRHEKRVHRDIKPSNLLINSLGEVKITDFGIASELKNSIAMCGTFVGTYKYMSPERIKNKPYSYASDIWSFGLSLIELATGKYPFTESVNCIEMAQIILESNPTPLPNGIFTEEFHDFIYYCLQRNPDQRPAAEELLHHPWLKIHDATEYDLAVYNVQSWIQDMCG